MVPFIMILFRYATIAIKMVDVCLWSFSFKITCTKKWHRVSVHGRCTHHLTHSLTLFCLQCMYGVDKKIYIHSEFTNSLFVIRRRGTCCCCIVLLLQFDFVLSKNPPSISFTNQNTNREIRWKFSWFIVKQIAMVLVMRQHSVYTNAFSFASSNT